jgi:cytochrome b pre-mRNA-processing protein 3
LAHSVTRLLRRGSAARPAAEAAYRAVVAQARRPEFYRALGVPDTLDGRFELIALHVFLVLRRLKGEASARDMSQALADRLFEDLDRSLREMGAGDLGVGRRVKAMARAFYGRIAAYEAGLAAGGGALAAALGRNLYGTAAPPESVVDAMEGYLRREAASLAARDVSEIVAGRPAFGPPPEPGGAP